MRELCACVRTSREMTSLSRTGVCGCRGARSCLLCEGGSERPVKRDETPTLSFYLCHICGEVHSSADCREDHAHPPLRVCGVPCTTASTLLRCANANAAPFDGVTVVKEFITPREEVAILSSVDSQTWVQSQSGRRKQDYGPKVNFKQQKIKVGRFNGLPQFIERLVRRMREEVDVLADFVPVELCNLDYQPERGAHIEAHRDDSWLWGERLVTLNLCSPTLLTFSLPTSLHPHPPQGTLHPHPPQGTLPEIQIPLPQRSLVVIQGHARHLWLHSIERQHIISRRVGITLRELTNEFLPGGHAEEIGGRLLDIAQQFSGEPTNL